MSEERTYTRSELVKAVQELHERAIAKPDEFMPSCELDDARGEGVMAAVDALLDGTYDVQFGSQADAE